MAQISSMSLIRKIDVVREDADIAEIGVGAQKPRPSSGDSAGASRSSGRKKGRLPAEALIFVVTLIVCAYFVVQLIDVLGQVVAPYR